MATNKLNQYKRKLQAHGLYPGSFLWVKKDVKKKNVTAYFVCPCSDTKAHKGLNNQNLSYINRDTALRSLVELGYQFAGVDVAMNSYRFSFVVPQCCALCRGGMEAEC